jgi:hypothetical protein
MRAARSSLVSRAGKGGRGRNGEERGNAAGMRCVVTAYEFKLVKSASAGPGGACGGLGIVLFDIGAIKSLG